jgi:putative phage-type endonuclease
MDRIIQGTDEWFIARSGKATASRIADLINKTAKGAYASTRETYAKQLIVERLTGAPSKKFTSEAMRWGTTTEADARAAYVFNRAARVEEVGFILHPTVGDSGASPDGLSDDDGLLEIKCPTTETHIETLLTQEVPEEYIPQMQWQMACTGRVWCDFVSFDPRLIDEPKRFFCKRVMRDNAFIATLEREVIGFMNEVRGTVAKLDRIYPSAPIDESAELLMAG